MTTTSVPLLLIAAGTVGFLHSILPDHWVPLAVIGRTQRWSIGRVAGVSFLASIGHVVTSIAIGAIIAVVGLQFRSTFETQQGHIVGVVLIATGIGFLVWGLLGGGHGHDHSHSHEYPHGHDHADSGHSPSTAQKSLMRRFGGIVIPFGAAASPDLTILPIFLAASAVGTGAVIGVLTTFSIVTLATFVVLTVAATMLGYQIKGEWLEKHGNTITAFVLLAIGVAVFAGI
jgi:hypothetical protein